MIISYEVGAVFRIIDEGSPALRPIGTAAGAPEEIEITEEMIDAGAKQLRLS